MPRYVVLKDQKLDPCDYTIGWGKNFHIEKSDLNVKDFKELMIKRAIMGDEDEINESLEELITEYSLERDERFISEITVIDLDNGGSVHVMDMNLVFDGLESMKTELENMMKPQSYDQDMEELKRLKQMYPEKFK